MPSLDIDVSVEFEVWCSCGAGLCRQTTVDGTSITVEPCEACCEKARDEGYDEGSEAGYAKAMAEET